MTFPTINSELPENDCVHLLTKGVSKVGQGYDPLSPTCLDVLVQLVNEGIQLLAVLRLQL